MDNSDPDPYSSINSLERLLKQVESRKDKAHHADDAFSMIPKMNFEVLIYLQNKKRRN